VKACLKHFDYTRVGDKTLAQVMKTMYHVQNSNDILRSSIRDVTAKRLSFKTSDKISLLLEFFDAANIPDHIIIPDAPWLLKSARRKILEHGTLSHLHLQNGYWMPLLPWVLVE
jgi:hypothetical protein